MFLWVNDFYSLKKIISAFPEIVLLYLKKKKKKTGDWTRRVDVWGGGWGSEARWMEEESQRGRRRGCAGGICAAWKARDENGFVLVSKSRFSLSASAPHTGQGGRLKEEEDGGDGDQGLEDRVHSSQVWLIALDTDSF